MAERLASDGRKVGRRAIHAGWARSPEKRAVFYGIPLESAIIQDASTRKRTPPVGYEIEQHGRCVTLMRGGQRVNERPV